MDKKELENAIDSLAGVFQKERDQPHKEWVQETLKKYPHYDLKKPDQFTLLAHQTTDAQLDLLARYVLADVKVDRVTKYRLQFVYTHYDFIVNHLKSLILPYEGHACSTDKTRRLTNMYLNYKIHGALPSFTETRSYQPKVGTAVEWVEWMETMFDLYQGKSDAYMNQKTAFIQQYEHFMTHAIDFYHKTYTADAHFTTYELVEENHHYTFVDSATQDELMIQLKPNVEMGYRLLLGPKKKRSSYGDEKPEWVKTLLDVMYEPENN